VAGLCERQAGVSEARPLVDWSATVPVAVKKARIRQAGTLALQSGLGLRADLLFKTDSPQSHEDTKDEKVVDEIALLFYYHLNTGKEVIQKYMSSNHSEVAET